MSKFKRAKVCVRLVAMGGLYALAGLGVGSLYGADSGTAVVVAGAVVKGVMYGMALLFGGLAAAVTLLASDEQIAGFNGRVF